MTSPTTQTQRILQAAGSGGRHRYKYTFGKGKRPLPKDFKRRDLARQNLYLRNLPVSPYDPGLRRFCKLYEWEAPDAPFEVQRARDTIKQKKDYNKYAQPKWGVWSSSHLLRFIRDGTVYQAVQHSKWVEDGIAFDTPVQRQVWLQQEIAWPTDPRAKWKSSTAFDPLDVLPPPEVIPISSDDEEEEGSDLSRTEEDNDIVNMMIDTSPPGWGVDFGATITHDKYTIPYCSTKDEIRVEVSYVDLATINQSEFSVWSTVHGIQDITST